MKYTELIKVCEKSDAIYTVNIWSCSNSNVERIMTQVAATMDEEDLPFKFLTSDDTIIAFEEVPLPLALDSEWFGELMDLEIAFIDIADSNTLEIWLT